MLLLKKIVSATLALFSLSAVGANDTQQISQEQNKNTEVKAQAETLKVDQDGYLVFSYDHQSKTRKGSPLMAKKPQSNGK